MAQLPAQDHVALNVMEIAAKRAARETRRLYLGMSSIGDPCGRKLWYRFRGFTPLALEGRMKRLFELGDLVEEKLIRDLREAGYTVRDRDPETGRQYAFSDFGGLFRGHSDGEIEGLEASRRVHVLECKSANKNKFQSFRKVGVRRTYPVYYAQVQCYMGYSGLERALVVVDCKDSSDLYTERISFNREDFDSIRNRAMNILKANEIPDRAFDKPTISNCHWCEMRLHCWRPEEAIQMEETCGTCHYAEVGFPSLGRNWCRHPDHPLEIRQWGLGCPDWSWLCAKGTPADPIENQRLRRVPLEELGPEVKEAVNG